MKRLDAKSVADYARSAFGDLFGRIREGDADAAKELVQVIHAAVESLTYSQDPHGLLRAIARNRSSWPVLTFARQKDGEAYMRAIANKFQLGEECGLKLRGKKADFRTPETKAAFALYLNVEMDRQRGRRAIGSRDLIPTLSRNKNTLTVWWRECERVLPQIFGERFEEHPEFGHWKKKQHTVSKRVGGKLKEAKEAFPRWELRKEIKKKLRQSLASLAS